MLRFLAPLLVPSLCLSAQTHVTTAVSPTGTADAFGEHLDFVDLGSRALILVGAPNDGAVGVAAGRAYLVDADSGKVVRTYDGPGALARFGSGVSALGDVTGDGVPEVVVGAPGVQPAGMVQVLELGSTTPLYTVPGLAPGEALGGIVEGLGDVNGDGVADFLAGSLQLGGVRAHDGATGAVIHDATGQQGFFNVGRLGDMSGDGIPDYAFSHVGFGSTVQVRSGNNGAVLFTWGPALLQPTSFDGFGVLLDVTGGTTAGDANADGFLDVAIGLPSDNTNGINAGRISIYSGHGGSELQKILGTQAGEQLGFLVSAGGDFNLDGFGDVFEVPDGNPRELKGFSGQDGGELFAYSPIQAGGVTTITGRRNAIAGARDFTGDGRPELVVGDGTTGLVRVTSPVTLPLHSDWDVTFGNSQPLELDAGPAHAGEVYLVVGSFSGTSPGVSVLGVTLPLNPDAYLSYSATHPNQSPLLSTLGTLDGSGKASATIEFIPQLAGRTVHHAFLTISPLGAATFASNALPLHFFSL